jgi:hypothetical protein
LIEQAAERLGIRTISGLRLHPELRLGFSNEFMDRADGYPGLARLYGLRFSVAARVMDLGLTYRALADSVVDLIAGNSTDGQIEALDQTALPHLVRTLRIGTVDELIQAITGLAIRGAPAAPGTLAWAVHVLHKVRHIGRHLIHTNRRDAEEARRLARAAVDSLGGMGRFVSRGHVVWV